MEWKGIKKCLVCWNTEPASVDDLKKVQVIVTHCAELLRDGTAGQGNILIAEHADKLRKRFGLPIIAQREILVAKPDLEVFAVVGAGPNNSVRHRPADTYEVCVAQKKICDPQNWKNVLVVTFPEHMWRACAVYKKLGLNPIPAVILGNSKIYYEKNARRWQLRSRDRFKYLWEIPARLLFLKRGWM